MQRKTAARREIEARKLHFIRHRPFVKVQMSQGDDAHLVAPASVDHGHRDEVRRQLVVKQRRALDELQRAVRFVEDRKIAGIRGIPADNDIHAVVDHLAVLFDVRHRRLGFKPGIIRFISGSVRVSVDLRHRISCFSSPKRRCCRQNGRPHCSWCRCRAVRPGRGLSSVRPRPSGSGCCHPIRPIS